MVITTGTGFKTNPYIKLLKNITLDEDSCDQAINFIMKNITNKKTELLDYPFFINKFAISMYYSILKKELVVIFNDSYYNEVPDNSFVFIEGISSHNCNDYNDLIYIGNIYSCLYVDIFKQSLFDLNKDHFFKLIKDSFIKFKDECFVNLLDIYDEDYSGRYFPTHDFYNFFSYSYLLFTNNPYLEKSLIIINNLCKKKMFSQIINNLIKHNSDFEYFKLIFSDLTNSIKERKKILKNKNYKKQLIRNLKFLMNNISKSNFKKIILQIFTIDSYFDNYYHIELTNKISNISYQKKIKLKEIFINVYDINKNTLLKFNHYITLEILLKYFYDEKSTYFILQNNLNNLDKLPKNFKVGLATKYKNSIYQSESTSINKGNMFEALLKIARSKVEQKDLSIFYFNDAKSKNVLSELTPDYKQKYKEKIDNMLENFEIISSYKISYNKFFYINILTSLLQNNDYLDFVYELEQDN